MGVGVRMGASRLRIMMPLAEKAASASMGSSRVVAARMLARLSNICCSAGVLIVGVLVRRAVARVRGKAERLRSSWYNEG